MEQAKSCERVDLGGISSDCTKDGSLEPRYRPEGIPEYINPIVLKTGFQLIINVISKDTEGWSKKLRVSMGETPRQTRLESTAAIVRI